MFTNNIAKMETSTGDRNLLIQQLLSGITTEELEQLVAFRKQLNGPIPAPRTKQSRPKPKPRQSVKQMVQEYEKNIIKPQIPKRLLKHKSKAFKNYTKSFEVSIMKIHYNN